MGPAPAKAAAPWQLILVLVLVAATILTTSICSVALIGLPPAGTEAALVHFVWEDKTRK